MKNRKSFEKFIGLVDKHLNRVYKVYEASEEAYDVSEDVSSFLSELKTEVVPLDYVPEDRQYKAYEVHEEQEVKDEYRIDKNGGKGVKTILIANQKGGIAKTTTCTALASGLALKGYKTLLIDADPQSNSTDTYRAEIEGQATLYDVLLDKDRISLAEAVQKTEAGAIVAADTLLSTADQILLSDPEGFYRMVDAIRELETYVDPDDGLKYDYVVIDTGPADNSILKNCMVAADYIVIPVTADRYSLQGLSKLNDTILAIQRRYNRSLRVLGLLLVKFDKRTKLGKEVREVLDSVSVAMNTKVFDSTIRESIKAKEAQAKRKTLYKYAPYCTTAFDYKRFIDELVEEVKQ